MLCACLLPAQLFAQSQIAGQLDAYLSSIHFNGTVLIAQKGNILLEKGYGWKNRAANTLNDANTVYQIASITKQLTAALIMQLQEAGRLKVQDHLSDYFPDFPGSDKITLEHLLTHTSGIYDYMRHVDPEDSAIVVNPVDEKIFRDIIWEAPARFAPGTKWEYSNSGYYFLGKIIEKLTGKSYYDVLQERILQPLGMRPVGFDFIHFNSPDKAQGYLVIDEKQARPTYAFDSTVSYAAGALFTTAGALYRWDRAIHNDMTGQAPKVLQPASWQQVFRPFFQYNGYGWITDTLYGRQFMRHGGNMPGFSTDILRMPAADITLILLANRSNQDHTDLMVKLTSIVLQEKEQHPEVVLSEQQLKAFTGKYTGAWQLDVKAAGRQLEFSVKGDPGKYLLTPAGGNIFYAKTPFGQFIFSADGLKINRLGHVLAFGKSD